MSTIKQNLKRGIEEKDWSLVIAAYEALSGEKIQQTKQSSTDDFIFRMNREEPRRTASRDVEQEHESESSTKEKIEAKAIDFRSERRFNMFVDDNTEALADKEFDKTVKPARLTKKGERRESLVETTCVKCNKQFKVHPDLYKGYICNKCQARISRV